MRILLVVHAFPPQTQGGAEIYAEQHARTLVSLFHDKVHVLAREQRPDRPEYAVTTEQRDGFTVTWINNSFRDVRAYEESYRCPAIARIAADVIDRFRPEVAHIHHLTCLSTEIPKLLRSRDVPVLFTLHDYWLMCHRGQLLDTTYRLCAGPEPSGCRSCLGIASAPVPSAVVPAVREIDRRLPRTLSTAARAVATRISSGGEDPAARDRLEHMREVCQQITRFLAPSRSIQERFISFGIAQERIEHWPYGFNLAWRQTGGQTWGQTEGQTKGSDQRSDPRSDPESDPRSDPRLRIGFLGTLMVSKAPHVLLEAFRRLPADAASVDLLGAPSDYHGDASYRGVLEPLLKLPGVNLRGPQPRGRVADALRSLDVLVVPSVWPETSPLVIREAFLTGVPVVASNIGGIPELIEAERNGLLFEPGDVDGLARALRRLAEEPGLLHRLKAGAAATPVRSLDDDVRATRRLYGSFSPSRLKPAPTTAPIPTTVAALTTAPGPKLAAIVLNYQTPEDTAIAVASLMASDRPPDHLIVVDNDAGPECQKALRRWGDRITYLRTGTNLGFAGGMNVGIRRALDDGAGLVLLVNSDMVVPPDCIGRLEAATKAGAGIAGPLVLSRSVPDMIGSAGIDYNATTGRMRHRDVGNTAGPAKRTHQTVDVDAVTGCLMLITRGVFDRIGLIDERYFFSFEEIDFCLRARTAGFRIQLAADAVAYHEGGRAIGAHSVRRFYFAARNHMMLAQRANGDGLLKRGLRSAFVVALNLAHAVRAPGGSLAARIGATLRGIRDYLAGRDGADRSA